MIGAHRLRRARNFLTKPVSPLGRGGVFGVDPRHARCIGDIAILNLADRGVVSLKKRQQMDRGSARAGAVDRGDGECIRVRLPPSDARGRQARFALSPLSPFSPRAPGWPSQPCRPLSPVFPCLVIDSLSTMNLSDENSALISASRVRSSRFSSRSLTAENVSAKDVRERVEAFVQSALRDIKDHHGQAARRPMRSDRQSRMSVNSSRCTAIVASMMSPRRTLTGNL